MRVTGKSVDCIYNDPRYPAFVLAAIGEHLLKLRPVRRLGAFSFFHEKLVHLEAVLGAVVTTRLLLSRQAKIVHLVFRGNAAVNNGSIHGAVWLSFFLVRVRDSEFCPFRHSVAPLLFSLPVETKCSPLRRITTKPCIKFHDGRPLFDLGAAFI